MQLIYSEISHPPFFPLVIGFSSLKHSIYVKIRQPTFIFESVSFYFYETGRTANPVCDFIMRQNRLCPQPEH